MNNPSALDAVSTEPDWAIDTAKVEPSPFVNVIVFTSADAVTTEEAVIALSSASVAYVASKLLEKSSKLVTRVDNDALSLAKAPLTEATIASLEVDEEADNAATEPLIV